MKKRSTAELFNEKGNIEQLVTTRNPICLILEDIRSVYNIGAIFRTADAANVEKLYLCGITAHPPRPDLEKTALRTTEFVPWEYHQDPTIIIKSLKSLGYQIIALEQTNESISYLEYSYRAPMAIVLGNEVDGISQAVLDLCDAAIEIPMSGISNSLNVTTAIGITLFKAIETTKS